jgi:hypothetical protein
VSQQLASWNDSPTRHAIVDFVARVTEPNGAGFVPVPERIATFDADDTLWSEKPVQIQIAWIPNGDIPMLELADNREGPSLCLLVNHDDAIREASCGAGAEKAMAAAKSHNWSVVSVLDDWSRVLSFQ